MSTVEILFGAAWLTTSGKDGHTVANGNGLGGIISGYSDFAVEIAHKSFNFLELGIQINFEE